MCLTFLVFQLQKQNYRQEKKRAAKELFSALKDPSVVIMSNWLKVCQGYLPSLQLAGNLSGQVSVSTWFSDFGSMLRSPETFRSAALWRAGPNCGAAWSPAFYSSTRPPKRITGWARSCWAHASWLRDPPRRTASALNSTTRWINPSGLSRSVRRDTMFQCANGTVIIPSVTCRPPPSHLPFVSLCKSCS